ncbi:potassium channel family protein [Stutzerimonas stutzeri]|uniref:potassium channel family protein n=1 Tax=Stutzerimonas stutzeri TaxID=316 RepID=UPI0004BC0A4D|nr:potassium channel family protein [Stutzerimonas stutzeri]MCQ4327830.1 potassium channel family protein [Stutzerimonas stutzeri]
MRGGGKITNGLSRGVWRAFFLAAGRRGESKLLEYAGQCVLLSILLCWIAGLWLSLFLVLASHPGSVVDGTTKLAANLWETFYYAGFTLSTLGVGDYSASANGWRVLTSAAAFCGLAFITVAITYLVPVLSAVGLQNQLSILVTSMGRTPQQILLNSWSGTDFAWFYDGASKLSQMLVQHTLNHHSHPVVHCFHNSEASKSIIPAIVTLDETLRLLDRISSDVPQDRLKRKMLKTAIDQHLEMLRSNYLRRVSPTVPAPVVTLEPLEQAGIPLIEPGDEQPPRLDERRKLLGALLEADGWSWDDVFGADQRAEVGR